MTHLSPFRFPATAVLALLPLAAAAQQTPSPELAPIAPPSVVIDGTPVAFDQPPVMDAGRIFVPLRGVFERLGASVVFGNGQINATSGSHTIGLHLGESTAIIDGTTRQLETPPMLVGGRVLVPLRFVAEALGAIVRFDANTQTAYITQPPAPRPMPATTPPPPPIVAPPPAVPQEAPSVLNLIREEPLGNGSVVRKRPEISATFAQPVDPNSVQLRIDDRNVTPNTYVSERGFIYDPAFDLPEGSHRVTVSGKTQAHDPFETSWTFSTSGSTNTNFVTGLEPPSGLTVTSPLNVSGLTRPNSVVKIIASVSDAATRFSEGVEGTFSTTVIADAHGYFQATLEFTDAGSGIIDVRVESTAPGGGVAARTLRLRT